jgi:hypothetical protein
MRTEHAPSRLWIAVMRITPAARALIAQSIRNRMGEFWKKTPVLLLAPATDADDPGGRVRLQPFPRDQVLTPVEIIECDELEVFLILTRTEERLYRAAIVDAYAGRLWLIEAPR